MNPRVDGSIPPLAGYSGPPQSGPFSLAVSLPSGCRQPGARPYLMQPKAPATAASVGVSQLVSMQFLSSLTVVEAGV